MNKIIILRGLPGSGKTTFAREWIDEDPERRVRISQDGLRDMLNNKYEPSMQDLLRKVEVTLIYPYLASGYDVIIDDTNLKDERVQTIKDDFAQIVAQDGVYEVEEKWIELDVEECISRDALRDKPVGEKVIRDMYEKYLKPKNL